MREMPTLDVKTNVKISDDKVDALIAKLSALVADMLGKPVREISISNTL